MSMAYHQFALYVSEPRQKVMCILFSIPPARKRDDQNRPYEDYWEVAKKKLLADPSSALN